MNGTVYLGINNQEFELQEGDKSLIMVDGEPYWASVSLTKAIEGKPYRDREWLVKMYHTEEKTLQQIGDLCGVSPMTINQWLRKHNIPSRSRGRR